MKQGYFGRKLTWRSDSNSDIRCRSSLLVPWVSEAFFGVRDASGSADRWPKPRAETASLIPAETCKFNDVTEEQLTGFDISSAE